MQANFDGIKATMVEVQTIMDRVESSVSKICDGETKHQHLKHDVKKLRAAIDGFRMACEIASVRVGNVIQAKEPTPHLSDNKAMILAILHSNKKPMKAKDIARNFLFQFQKKPKSLVNSVLYHRNYVNVLWTKSDDHTWSLTDRGRRERHSASAVASESSSSSSTCSGSTPT